MQCLREGEEKGIMCTAILTPTKGSTTLFHRAANVGTVGNLAKVDF